MMPTPATKRSQEGALGMIYVVEEWMLYRRKSWNRRSFSFESGADRSHSERGKTAP